MNRFKRKLPRVLKCRRDAVVDYDLIQEYLAKHRLLAPDYVALKNEYAATPPILYNEIKEVGKPDNRLVVSHGHHLVDTFDGFFIGKPVQVSSDDEIINAKISEFNRLNNLEDENAELSKIASIYGHALELIYQDEEANTRVTYFNPLEAFIVYDDRPNPKKKFAVHLINGGELVTVYTDTQVITLGHDEQGTFTEVDEIRPNLFGEVPFIEYVHNEERIGVFEPALTLINYYNEALSAKANDVDYFADAYMKVVGVKLSDEMKKDLRDLRIVNMWGRDLANIADVDFLQKPNADITQENLLNRLDRKIFQICNVADITDEKFGNATGIAKEMKLQGMSNQAKMKERKFQKALSERYRLFFKIALNGRPDDWLALRYNWSRNLPRDIEKEANVAQTLKGIVSDETLLNYLSIVDDPKEELERLASEGETVTEDLFTRLKGEA